MPAEDAIEAAQRLSHSIEAPVDVTGSGGNLLNARGKFLAASAVTRDNDDTRRRRRLRQNRDEALVILRNAAG